MWLDKGACPVHTGNQTGGRGRATRRTRGQSTKGGGEDGGSVDRQHQYFPSGLSHHHGLLPYDSGKHADPVAKKGMKFLQGNQGQCNNGWCREKHYSSIPPLQYSVLHGCYLIFQIVPEGVSSKTIPFEIRSSRISSAFL